MTERMKVVLLEAREISRSITEKVIIARTIGGDYSGAGVVRAR